MAESSELECWLGRKLSVLASGDVVVVPGRANRAEESAK